MNKNTFFKILLVSIIGCLFSAFALAKVGVGVNLGKIEVDEPLKPGGIYNFPSMGVFNTGNESGEYELAVTYHQDQSQMRPSPEWFSFNPSSFHLEPGQSKDVVIKLALPVRVKPGDYFCYLEAHPVMRAGVGATVGVAAATKTYFTVAPANIWQAMYYKIISFLTMYAPWTYVVLAVVVAAIIIVIFKRFFVFQISRR